MPSSNMYCTAKNIFMLHTPIRFIHKQIKLKKILSKPNMNRSTNGVKSSPEIEEEVWLFTCICIVNGYKFNMPCICRCHSSCDVTNIWLKCPESDTTHLSLSLSTCRKMETGRYVSCCCSFSEHSICVELL